jgi:hypothetical protein
MNNMDFQDVKLARPIAIVDLWDVDGRVNRLDNCIDRLERITQILIEYSHDERVRDFERILKEAMDREDAKKEGKVFVKPIFNMDALDELDSFELI